MYLMPVTPTFPGVYIEEIPSGVRTITGVATSITAFVGSAQRGPENQPVTINSFSDFVRQFGGLWSNSYLGHAVSDFFLNGGSQAIIVRVVQTTASTTPVIPAAAPASIDLPTATAGSPLTLHAANSGAWGNNLSAAVDWNTVDATNKNLFNLTILENDPTTKAAVNVENFLNVSILDTDTRYIPRVLKQSSQLVRVKLKGTITDPNDPWDVPTVRPKETIDATTKKQNPVKATAGSGMDGPPLTSGLFTDTPKKGINALDSADLFNILCIPPYLASRDVDTSVVSAAAEYCEKRRAILLVDPISTWASPADAIGDPTATPPTGVSGVGTNSKNAALFFPRLRKPNPLRDNQLDDFVPCGAVAGIFARTDTQRGVWKAPAGLDATLVGVPQLSVLLNDAENGELNPLGINCMRAFPAAGRVVWGARTLKGNDVLASEWKYIPVRRTALYIEESLYRGTQWVVFEPNDEPLWAQIRLNVGAFMQNLFRQGAFQGQSPRDAYFVKCDKETTTQNDINLGIVNIVVGFAPLKPAEFVIIQLQQMAGQIAV
jgi:phage tail sheath protein FI